MIYQSIDGVAYKMKEEFDFAFLKKYGKVFKVFDNQDSGNICFGIDSGKERYFVKFAGAPTAEYQGELQDAVSRLKATVPIYQDIRHDTLVRFLFAEEIGRGFAMVFEWADGTCMGKQYEDGHRSILALPVHEKIGIFQRIAAFMQCVARSGYVAINFYDGSILYDANTRKVTVCDMDCFRKSPCINDMGRMWGSSRFMSPEEYEKGAVIDEVTNVYNLAQMAFSLFTDSDRQERNWPLSKESYAVLLKATSAAREDRFPSIADFIFDWENAVSLA